MNSRRRKAFTLLELVVTTTILGIVAATAAPMFFHTTGRRLRRAAHDLATHIKLARDLAIATQRHTWVDFNTNHESYRIYIEDPDNPGRAHRIYVTHPVDGGNFVVALDSGEFDGVRIHTASFRGRSEVEFDWSGVPYNGNGQALTSDGTVVLVGGGTQTVRVTRDTGYVQEE